MEKVIDGVVYVPKKITKPRKIRVVFELTMPNKGSWNGKWSAEKDGHFIFKEYSNKYFEENKDKLIGSWRYDWGDGWAACVTSRVIDGDESRKMKRANRGFSGYDWMVDSIVCVGEIMTRDELRKFLKEKQS